MRLSIDKKNKIFFYVLIFLLLSTVNNLGLSTNKINYFQIKNIDIKGVEEQHKQEIINSLSFLINQNILFLNKNLIQKKIDEFNFIHSYEIFKKFPSFLRIEIKKTELVAVKIKENKKYYIGKNGKLIDYSRFENKKKLPYAFGNFDEKDFFDLFKILNNNNFNTENIKGYYYFANKRWDLKLKDDTLIKLPQKDLNNFISIAKTILKNKSLNKKKIIDLRIPNQIIISYE